jgi:hypothetical protein
MHVADKDLTSALSEKIEDGPLLGAVYARIDTAVGFTRMFTPLGNYLIARPAARAKAHSITERTEVPLDGGMVLGCTAGNLHVWSADIMMSQVHDHLGSVSRELITGIEVGSDKSWQPLTITLKSGEKVEVQARGGVHQFATSFS